MSRVIFLNVPHERGGVQKTVREAMEIINWENHLRGKKVFVKVNLISSEFVPGQCTSPAVLDEILYQLTSKGYEVTLGDADLAAACQCNKAAVAWGHKKLAEKYGAKFQNLSEDELVDVEVDGKVFKTLQVPKSVLEADSIISLPVMKTHCLTGLTCALKHFWGVVPRVRHQYHLVVDDAIVDINSLLKPKVAFALVDGTVAMEGNGPRTGIPKICDIIMASDDLVALDAAVSKYMGLSTPAHVKRAAEKGLGSLKYELLGDAFQPNPFLPPEPDKQPIFYWEMKLRRTFLKPILFDTKIFSLLAWIATKYNTFWYYRLRGKKYTKEIMKTRYGGELREILGAQLEES